MGIGCSTLPNSEAAGSWYRLRRPTGLKIGVLSRRTRIHRRSRVSRCGETARSGVESRSGGLPVYGRATPSAMVLACSCTCVRCLAASDCLLGSTSAMSWSMTSINSGVMISRFSVSSC